MKKNKLVSIIIPIYNVESYLRKCIQSIIAQTYTNIEIILVDDGSPDNSGKICDEFSKVDNRIVVIHKKNDGVSNARNSGMKVAKGDYLYFIDGDDYAEKDAIEVLVGLAEKEDADLVIAEINIVNGSGEKIGKINDSISEDDFIIFNSFQAIDFFVQKDWGPWNKLYARHVHDNVEFPSHKIHEDEAIMLKLLQNSRKIVYTGKRLYNYLKRDGSTTSVGYSVKKMDWFEVWRDNVEYVSVYYPALINKAVSKLVVTVIYNYDYLAKMDIIKYEKEITSLIDCLKKYFFKIVKNRYVKISYKLRVVLAVCNPKIYHLIYMRFSNR